MLTRRAFLAKSAMATAYFLMRPETAHETSSSAGKPAPLERSYGLDLIGDFRRDEILDVKDTLISMENAFDPFPLDTYLIKADLPEGNFGMATSDAADIKKYVSREQFSKMRRVKSILIVDKKRIENPDKDLYNYASTFAHEAVHIIFSKRKNLHLRNSMAKFFTNIYREQVSNALGSDLNCSNLAEAVEAAEYVDGFVSEFCRSQFRYSIANTFGCQQDEKINEIIKDDKSGAYDDMAETFAYWVLDKHYKDDDPIVKRKVAIFDIIMPVLYPKNRGRKINGYR